MEAIKSPLLETKQNSVEKRLAQQMVNARDQMLIDALEKVGYKFKNKERLKKFIKKHCKIALHKTSRVCQLIVKGVFVAQWYDTARMRKTSTGYEIIAGEKPGGDGLNLKMI